MERFSSIESLITLALALVLVATAVLWVGRQQQRYAKLAAWAVALTFVVVVVGAFVRLTDAGLGCPDWPGCYGDLTPATAKNEILAAESANPFGPVTMAKAWKEMGHRYLAAILGSLIIALAIAAWRGRRTWASSPWLATSIVGVVILQGAFGAWTVTLLLKPAIVTGHLIGGMLTLSLLMCLALLARPAAPLPAPASARALLPFAWLTLVVIAMQIILGGWVSTNYAALACTDFPTCQGAWVPPMNFDHAFDIIRKLGMTKDGEPIPFEALTAIHFTHRVFAVLVTLVVVILSLRLWKTPGLEGLGRLLLILLAVQIALGISNVVFGLPLAVAVAHNGGAALLLLTLVTLLTRLIRRA
jgi:cytochrome c oxidase assembly protein subunit 15